LTVAAYGERLKKSDVILSAAKNLIRFSLEIARLQMDGILGPIWPPRRYAQDDSL